MSDDTPMKRRSARIKATDGDGASESNGAAPELSEITMSKLQADSSFKQTISFPKWDDGNKLQFSTFEMKVRAFITRSGHKSIFDVIDGYFIIDDFPEEHAFHAANEAYYCDLVLNITGRAAAEQLQAATTRLFTEAWPLLQAEFGTTSSLRKMEIIRDLTSLNMNEHMNEITAYKARALELWRQMKVCNITAADVATYSVIYGLDHNYDAYKLMAQDKMDRGVLGSPDEVIQGLTNAGECIQGARNISGSYKLPSGKYIKEHEVHRAKSQVMCEHCHKSGHTKDQCFDLHPEILEDFKARRKAKKGADGDSKLDLSIPNVATKAVKLRDAMMTAKNMNQGKELTLNQIKTLVNSATEL